MVSIGKYIEQLKELQIKTATDSLQPNNTQKTEWHFGYVCGIKSGLDIALRLLETEPQENQEESGGSNHSSRKR